MRKKIVTIVGARPQFIKAAAISRLMRESYSQRVEEVLVHTGQHHDENMSDVFFEELSISRPQYNLSIAGGTHGAMTGRMLQEIEIVLMKERPDWVLIYGDTNSTIAGALAAAKLHIPVAHVEAGLRSFNRRMPEEVNRVLSDHVATLLFCPTEIAVRNLASEGIEQGVHNVGDVMYDVALFYGARSHARSEILKTLDLTPGNYVLSTCHRAENTDDKERLSEILAALGDLAKRSPVVLPLHPRTRALIENFGFWDQTAQLKLIEPASYLDMVALEQSASLICTDSGGVQKEAFFFGVPCVTMRDETEWVELVDSGWNRLAGANREAILSAASQAAISRPSAAAFYGDGHASEKILDWMTT